MGQDASANRRGANETALAEDKNFVHLPKAYSWWKDFKSFLTRLQAKEISTGCQWMIILKHSKRMILSKKLNNYQTQLISSSCQYSPISQFVTIAWELATTNGNFGTVN